MCKPEDEWGQCGGCVIKTQLMCKSEDKWGQCGGWFKGSKFNFKTKKKNVKFIHVYCKYYYTVQ